MKIFALYLQQWGRLCVFIAFIFTTFYVHAKDTEQHDSTSESIVTESANNAPSANVTGAQRDVSEENFPILQEDTQDSIDIQPIGLWNAVRVFIVLVLVIVGIYALVWVLKRFQSRSFTRSQTIRVLASRQLSGGGNVHLIKLGKSLFFIGVSNQNITLMKEIHQKEEMDEIDLSLSIVEDEEETKRSSFYKKIQHLFKNKRTSATDSKNKDSYQNNTIQETFGVIKSMFGKQLKRGKELDA